MIKKVFYFVVLFASILILLPSCSTLPNESSTDFTRAKYLTELSYLTRDKELVQTYRDAYLSGQTSRVEFKELNKWSKGRNREIILETIEWFLELEFEGQ